MDGILTINKDNEILGVLIGRIMNGIDMMANQIEIILVATMMPNDLKSGGMKSIEKKKENKNSEKKGDEDNRGKTWNVLKQKKWR